MNDHHIRKRKLNFFSFFHNKLRRYSITIQLRQNIFRKHALRQYNKHVVHLSVLITRFIQEICEAPSYDDQEGRPKLNLLFWQFEHFLRFQVSEINFYYRRDKNKIFYRFVIGRDAHDILVNFCVLYIFRNIYPFTLFDIAFAFRLPNVDQIFRNSVGKI